MAQKKMKAKAYTSSFWSKKRAESGVTLQELSEYLKCDYTSACHYLTGQTMPSTAVAVKICDLFDVDYKTGQNEFIKAHEAWKKAQADRKAATQPTTANAVEVEPPVEAPKTVTITVDDTLMNSLYGKLPYDAFKALLLGTADNMDILKMVYGKVDYSLYSQIAAILNK